MGFFNRMKRVFSTGQASAVDKARRLYDANDLEGAVNCLKEALAKREETGKVLAVIRECHDAYLGESHQKRLTEYRTTLSNTAFDTSNYNLIEVIMASVDKGLKEGIYSGKTRPEAEGLYKEYQKRFQELREKAQKEKHQEIIGRLKGIDPEDNADEFVTLVEEMRRMGGRLPQAMHSNYQLAQERSYILPENLQEFANYVIERSLGSGGFASVFLASPKGISFQAAIKIFSPQPSLVRESGLSLTELKERFRREAGIMLRLSTESIPGIVNARHTETWRGKPYLTMDYYPKNLSTLIGSDDELLQTGRGGYLSYDRAFPIISQILTSIHWLHNRSEPIIHRDLKPANILLDKDNRPYIGDFGLAREAGRANLLSKAFETVTGTTLASQYYGAPEQRGGFKETDQRADVFSLGLLIYRVLTGRLIGFHDLEPIERYVQGLGKDTANKMDNLLYKATRVEVDQRLADISTFLDVFSPEQAAVEIRQAAPSGPAPGEQFLTALELAYAFSPDGNLPENVRATLLTKSRALGLDPGEAELLEKDFRSRLGLSEDKNDRVISATSGVALKTGEEKGVGTLVITSEPEMATVSVDGIERGATPLTIDRVGAGEKTIRLKMNGFFPVSRIERITPDEETRIHIILEHQTGSFNVSAKTYSDAYPARFYLDGKLMGKPPLTVKDVTAGAHAYRFEADNHQEVSGEVVVNLDEEVKLDEFLKPLPGRVSLKSMPSGAVIWVDGKMSKLSTDVKVKISSGKHTITLKLGSYVDAEKEIEVLPGCLLEEEFQLVKNQGKINVVSIPDGAAIWMDGEDTEKKTDNLMEVLHGEHEVTLKLVGYKDAQERVCLEPEGFAEAEFRLEKGLTIVVPEPTFTDPITGMEFVYVPGGKFMMGDIFGDGEENEKPVHEVTLDGFYIGKYPVTEREWKQVMRHSMLEYPPEKGNYPANKVSWRATQKFLNVLISKNKGRYQFRLPTEAEWEFSARSGGKKEKYAGGDDVDAVASYSNSNEGFILQPVGKKLPNGLGLYDMSGNVSEWCQDWYGDYSSKPATNPKGPPSDDIYRVQRGGGPLFNEQDVRCFYRWFGTEVDTESGQYNGFRLVRELFENQRKINYIASIAEVEATWSPADGVFVDYGNGIVKDNNTGLEWKVALDRDRNWDEARIWVESLNIDDSGWRMPTMDELENLNRNIGWLNLEPLLNTSNDACQAWADEIMDSSRARVLYPGQSAGWEYRNVSNNMRAFAVRSRKR